MYKVLKELNENPNFSNLMETKFDFDTLQGKIDFNNVAIAGNIFLIIV